MPRKRYWKKRRASLQTDNLLIDNNEKSDSIKSRLTDHRLTEEADLIKNRLANCEESALLKNRPLSSSNICNSTCSNTFSNETSNTFSNQFGTSFCNNIGGDTNSLNMRETEPFKRCVYCPGSAEHKHTVWAHFSQGDLRFSMVSRGRQCTCNALMFLVYSKTVKKFTSDVIDDVLVKGDGLYNKVVSELQNCGHFKSYLLHFEELPSIIQNGSCTYRVLKYQPLWGTITDSPSVAFAQSIETAISEMLQQTGMGLVMAGAISSTILKTDDDCYIFFDSHSHGRDALYSPVGKAVCLIFHKFADLISYLYAFYESLGISFDLQFEIQPLTIELQNENQSSRISSILSPISNGQSRLSNKDAIDSYFKYQAEMDNRYKRGLLMRNKQYITMEKNTSHSYKSLQSKKLIGKQEHRQLYMKEYMRHKRLAESFKVNEKLMASANKRKARQNPEVRERDRLMTSCSMKRARQDPKVRERDRLMTSCSMKRARQDLKVRERDRLMTSCSMKRARQDPKVRERDRLMTSCSMKRARQDLKVRERDRLMTSSSMKKARQDPKVRERDKLMTSCSMKRARQDPKVRERDRLMTSCSMKKARQDPKVQERDRLMTSCSMKKARQDPKVQARDRLMTSCSMKKARQDPKVRERDRLMTSCSMKKARQDPKVRERDRLMASSSKKKARQDPKVRERDRLMTSCSMKRARQDPKVRERDRLMTSSSMKKARLDPVFVENEQIRNANNVRRLRQKKAYHDKQMKKEKSRMKTLRQNKRYRIKENSQKTHSNKGFSLSECIAKFHNSVKYGFSYICTICHQTWSVNSVIDFEHSTLNRHSDIINLCRTEHKSVDGKEWICRTCISALKEEKIPKLSVANLFCFPDIPQELKLHQLEERLLSLRIPFMQLRELPRGKQLSIKGNVVNCPVDVQPTVNALPRQLDDHITVPVKLKRKKTYKTTEFVENVRPNVVLKALQWLMDNSDIYKTSGIKVDTNWTDTLHSRQTEMTEFVEMDNNFTKTNDVNLTDTSSNALEEDDSDNFSEVDVSERISGNSDTLLESSENGSNYVYTFAPGEGQTPLSLYNDPDAEYMSFPTIYCGQRRPTNEQRKVNVHYSDIAKWELRSLDRRVANNVPNLFFKMKKLQMKQITDKVNLAVRRYKTKGKQITVGQVLNQSSVNDLVNLDEGYYILRTIRNSPAYLSKRKKDIFAMIRQLGLPTWFVSLSAADTRWKDLLKILAELNGNTICTEEDIENMSWGEITNLIQKDPVTCSRHFNLRIQQFITIVLKSPHSPIGEMSDYFCRTEFQNRGSPHVHMLIWVKNAPIYNKDPITDIIAFIDKHVSCSSNVPENMQQYVKLQTHRHSKTCRKKSKAICRFGFPHPPMSHTQILEPLQNSTEDYKKKFEDIQKVINGMKDEDKSLSYHDFLASVLKISDEEYIKCIRSSINSPKVFLKRNVSETRINPYMKIILQAWNANHDIQFVLDPYACAMYIVSYISKSERGMSTLLDQACKEARQGNSDIKKQVRHIGNKFVNAVETSAQEAAYLCLQLPLSNASREVVFINTSSSNERTVLLKSKNALEKLPADSTNIEADSIIKRYSKRPKQLENWCLADYASKLNVKYPKTMSQEDDVDWDRNDDWADDSDEAHGEENNRDKRKELINITLRNGAIFKERTSPRVIRYVRFNKKTDSENYHRERLLLFLPWRNEEADLLRNYVSYEEHYNNVKNIVNVKINEYEHFAEELDEAERQAQENFDEHDVLAPQTQHAASEEIEEGSVESERYIEFNPKRTFEQTNYDIGSDMGFTARSVEEVRNPTRISNEEYYKMVKKLNIKQTEFFIHVLHWIKTKDIPLYAFLSGGAGVGKSVLIRALYQALHRYLCAVEGENPDNVRILLCAPTGKAAFNVNGSTIHSTFKLPASQGFNYTPLESDSLNTLRVKYSNLSIILIDEVSMVGSGMLNYISERLKQIKGSDKPFGNVSVLLIGDLFQLKPVFDKWIFQNLSKGYGPLATNIWNDHFQMFELTQIMRQKDDLQFADLLNRLRENNHTEDDIKELLKQSVDKDHVPADCTVPHLYTTRNAAKSWNSKVFDLTNSEKLLVKSVDDVKSQDSRSVKEEILKKVSSDPSHTSGLMELLPVAVGLKYDLTVNIDTSDGLTNGATCILKLLDYRMENTTRPSILWVEFETEAIGMNWRKTYNHLYRNNIKNEWTPIFDVNRTFLVHHKTVTRIQFPLSPSAAKTIHKAQGSTLDAVYIDLSMNRSVPHIHYVALSRARSMSGLHITELNHQKISVDKAVSQEMQRLRNDPLPLCYIPVYKVNSSFKIAFNNVRSLNFHYDHIRQDPNITALNLVAFAETRLMCNENDDKFKIDGYFLVRNDENLISSGHRPPHGLAAYIRNELFPTLIDYQKLRSPVCECLKLNLSEQVNKTSIIIFYCVPKCTLFQLQEFIRKYLLPVINIKDNLIILGDFNFDITDGQNSQFEKWMRSTFNVKQIVSGITTDYNSTLDLLFTNIDHTHTDIIECFWSDHKLIYAAFDIFHTL